ncbi:MULTISPECIES: hypothetical protein [unclassified Halomonas]|uniref:hypothetical protein n=1 Tax=unclassified Halomonas TaxID=2609666 RepID=UPI0004BB20CA|nr:MULTISPECIES: hypothetical protein [unclassified Halomonas]PKH63490.1 hypothetical protein CXF94_01535 [Halomonas sp. Choline-3u-9]QGQ69810.1 hypothetical protein FDY98_06510 [Halomonas sp. PA16-9]
MINLESLISSNSSKDSVNGDWYVIQWSPEPRNGERFNLGVAVSHSGGDVDFKVLDFFNRFECVYGKSSEAVFHAQLAVEVIEHYLDERREDNLVVINQNPHFFIDKRGVVRGEDVHVLVNQLFDEMVPMGRPEEKLLRATSVSRTRAVNEVRRILRSRMGSLKNFMPSNPYVTPEGSSRIYLPVRTKNSTATVASARVSGEHTARLNIYEAQKDISLSKGFINKKNNYMHILLPDNNLSDKILNSIENQIDNVSYMLKKEDISLVTHNDEEELAVYIQEAYQATG